MQQHQDYKTTAHALVGKVTSYPTSSRLLKGRLLVSGWATVGQALLPIDTIRTTVWLSRRCLLSGLFDVVKCNEKLWMDKNPSV